MSTLEMKGELVEMLAFVHDESTLAQVRALLAQSTKGRNWGRNMSDNLTIQQREAIRQVIEEGLAEGDFDNGEEMYDLVAERLSDMNTRPVASGDIWHQLTVRQQVELILSQELNAQEAHGIPQAQAQKMFAQWIED